ncbi:DgyrCDS5892 [Dimorphilus gyrociliatus]|uniref:DgyrCDS5892 n=1 Tax=Dimorphilus gyrociliatus TaxID=2664684 RepID=A0A7I8VLA2_9ANNE|nr:DgyrCDS5892 [Dimorphilus gyrociliatus]
MSDRPKILSLSDLAKDVLRNIAIGTLLEGIRKRDLQTIKQTIKDYNNNKKTLKIIDNSVLLRCLKEAAEQDNEEIFTLLLRCEVGSNLRGKRGNRSFKCLYRCIALHLIRLGRKYLLKKLLEFTEGVINPNREPPSTNKLLRTTLTLGRHDCFRILLNHVQVTENKEAFVIVLNSPLEDKVELFKNMLSRMIKDEDRDQAILKYCLLENISTENLKSVLPFFSLSRRGRNHLCHSTLLSNHKDFFKFAVKEKIFSFRKEHVYDTLFYECSFLDELLEDYTTYYKDYLDKFFLPVQKFYILRRPSKLYTIFTHDKFVNQCQNHINALFGGLFNLNNSFSADLACRVWNIRQMWLTSFCLLIHFSHNPIGLSTDAINRMFACLITFFLDDVETLTFFGSLIATVVWYGYTYDNLTLNNSFFWAIDEKSSYAYFYELLLCISDQKSFNHLVKSRNGPVFVMPLKSMAKWCVRKQIGRPFPLRAKKLVEDSKLPFVVTSLLNLEKEMESLGFHRIVFTVKDGEVIFEKNCYESFDNETDIGDESYDSTSTLTSEEEF